MSLPLLVVDFDGTVCRGDAPVRYYAAVIADSMPSNDARAFLSAIERYLSDGPAAAAASTDTVEAAALREAADSWGAVLSLAARGYDVPAEVIGQAFARCRQWMIDPACAVEVVEPLMDTLADLRGDARIVLVTNSPRASMLPLLRRLGILDAFDGIVAGAAKPDGLRRFLQRSLGPDLRARPWRLFSIGDHYRNDIEPAVELGAGAGYIDRFGRADGPATARARRAEDLLPVVRAWAADPDGQARRAALTGRGGSDLAVARTEFRRGVGSSASRRSARCAARSRRDPAPRPPFEDFRPRPPQRGAATVLLAEIAAGARAAAALGAARAEITVSRVPRRGGLRLAPGRCRRARPRRPPPPRGTPGR